MSRFLSLLFGAVFTVSGVSAVERPPNFVVIFVDDLGYADLGCFGSPDIRTPHLDQLAKEGMRFTHFYAQHICGPSRTALMTGSHPLRVAEKGNVKRVHPVVHSDEITIAEILKTKGYATGCFGKWDMAGHSQDRFDESLMPNHQGFDYFFGTPSSNDRWVDLYKNDELIEKKTDMGTLTKRTTDEVVGFIESNQEKLFFAYVPYSMVHTRLDASADFKGKSPRGLYGDAVEEIDFNCGRIIDALKRLDLVGNTYFLFTSDNGPAFSLRPDQVPAGMDLGCRRYNCGFNGQKGSVYEGGIRVPMIVRWPDGLEGGLSSDAQIHFADWLPTLLAATGVERPGGRPLDGRDVLPVLRGENASEAPPLFWQLNQYQPVGWINAAMREGPWKLVRPHQALKPATDADKERMDAYVEMDIKYKYHPEEVTSLMDDPDPELIIPPPAEVELYNIEEDPLEKDNRAASEKERVGHMVNALDDWFAEVEAERARIRPDGTIEEAV